MSQLFDGFVYLDGRIGLEVLLCALCQLFFEIVDATVSFASV